MLLFPGEEDFGIAPVEALAGGVPVVALARGGALDYVRPGQNGLLVEREDPEAFVRAIRSAWSLSWDERAIRRSADPFSVDMFHTKLRSVLDATLGTGWRSSTPSRAPSPAPAKHQVPT